ncbi:alpha/beta fold hydrolase [Pinirhizobacter soli]|uniref:alpha/beta fold hydrolase n=1 Tax=Pinirhizobacter soli TaxID=2786953 RepID=UPI00202A2E4F|nr:alpha/beta hydrolase [Pinirhizobacter soli]
MNVLHHLLGMVMGFALAAVPLTGHSEGLHEGWQAVDGVQLFYREGGDPSAPTLVLLHGYPLSSVMYARLMDELVQQRHLHVIAMDYPAFGYSEAPDHRQWAYTFDHVADTVRHFLKLRGIERYGLYMQDYGVPVGFRLMSADPGAISFIVVQNGVIHLDGFPAAQDPNSPLRRHWAHRDASTDAKRTAYAQGLLAPRANGWTDEEDIGADATLLMVQSAQRSGVVQSRNDLWFDYGNNVKRYPAWQALLRNMKIPVLVLWGSRDDFFTTPGALAYLRDAPQAEIHILDAGHFASLQVPSQIAGLISTFLGRHPQLACAAGCGSP